MSNPLDAPETPSPEASTPISETTDSPSREPLAIEDSQPPAQVELVEETEEIQTLDLGEGNVIKLDRLGPMIINSDGTLSRIQNWQDLHPIEQERTVRLLVRKRNLVRLKQLDKENREGGEELTALKDTKE
ncbi:uncharacterized protein IL334_002158 [Kwoniella shivajii]|uniref:Uncharacterized protein n=1 Tax=Kwoniella shivajii TaxID=564305 RepID=A0ABZ1CTY2_9TREE|nr:hypothetical protein IL334_002158 [Kwoniella shivajii]